MTLKCGKNSVIYTLWYDLLSNSMGLFFANPVHRVVISLSGEQRRSITLSVSRTRRRYHGIIVICSNSSNVVALTLPRYLANIGVRGGVGKGCSTPNAWTYSGKLKTREEEKSWKLFGFILMHYFLWFR